MPWVAVTEPIFNVEGTGGCGTGAGGFKPGNKCAKGGGSGSAAARSDGGPTEASVKKAMPAGTKFNAFGATWHKDGGHAGSKAIDAAIEKFKSMGFEQGSLGQSGSPTGSVVGSQRTLTHPSGDTVTWSKSYGSTARDNSFFMSYERAKTGG